MNEKPATIKAVIEDIKKELQDSIDFWITHQGKDPVTDREWFLESAVGWAVEHVENHQALIYNETLTQLWADMGYEDPQQLDPNSSLIDNISSAVVAHLLLHVLDAEEVAGTYLDKLAGATGKDTTSLAQAAFPVSPSMVGNPPTLTQPTATPITSSREPGIEL